MDLEMSYFIKYEQPPGPTATSHVFLVSRVFAALRLCRGAAGFFSAGLYIDSVQLVRWSFQKIDNVQLVGWSAHISSVQLVP
jgi:hypothetical protein